MADRVRRHHARQRDLRARRAGRPPGRTSSAARRHCCRAERAPLTCCCLSFRASEKSGASRLRSHASPDATARPELPPRKESTNAGLSASSPACLPSATGRRRARRCGPRWPGPPWHAARRSAPPRRARPAGGRARASSDCAMAGARFAVGSSSRKTAGSSISTRPMASILRSPPLSLPAGRCSIVPSRGNTVSTCSMRGPIVLPGQQVAAHLKVLPDAERREDVVHLRHVAHPGSGYLLRGEVGDVPVAEQDPAGRDPHDPHQALEQGALARAVGADDRDDLAGLRLNESRPGSPDRRRSQRSRSRRESARRAPGYQHRRGYQCRGARGQAIRPGQPTR